jgi:WD40 repeat protein
MYHKDAIENCPLQVYESALLFSPADSLVRRLFQHEEPRGIIIKPARGNGWSACLQTLEGHRRNVNSVAFSHDSSGLASGSRDWTVKIWDASSGTCIHTLNGHSNAVTSVAFSHDSSRLASASWDRTVKIWDASNGTCLHTLEVGESLLNLSFDSTGTCLHTEAGDITIPPLQVSSSTDTAASRLRYQNISLSPDSIWIVRAGSNVLWIPSEYRPSRSAVSGALLGMGVRSGRIWFCWLI